MSGDVGGAGSESVPDETGFMTAGRFSAETLLSPKALRIYAERGLLSPARTDPVTGYRLYSPEQVRTGWLIGLLRSAGLSLDEIRRIVSGEDREARLRHLERSVTDLERRAEAVHAVLARARAHLREGDDVSPISSELELDRPVLSVLRRMAPHEMDTVIPRELARLRRVAAGAGLVVTGDPFGIFHAPISDDSDGPLEIALPTDVLAGPSATVPDGDVRSYRLPGGLVAVRPAEDAETRFPQILALYDEVHSWITHAGRAPVGPPREVWHNDPGDADPLRLTITWPYASPPA